MLYRLGHGYARNARTHADGGERLAAHRNVAACIRPSQLRSRRKRWREGREQAGGVWRGRMDAAMGVPCVKPCVPPRACVSDLVPAFDCAIACDSLTATAAARTPAPLQLCDTTLPPICLLVLPSLVLRVSADIGLLEPAQLFDALRSHA
eukprot:2399639-Pleurochrysis_carterae.AAC.1